MGKLLLRRGWIDGRTEVFSAVALIRLVMTSRHGTMKDVAAIGDKKEKNARKGNGMKTVRVFFSFPFSFFLKSLPPQRARNLKAAKGRWMLLAIILAFRFFCEEKNLPDADRKQLLVKKGAEGEKVSCSWFYIFIHFFFLLLLLAFPLLFAEARGRAFPSRLLEEFHSETPDVREWNGDLCVALPFQHLYHLARSLIFHPVMETQDEWEKQRGKQEADARGWRQILFVTADKAMDTEILTDVFHSKATWTSCWTFSFWEERMSCRTSRQIRKSHGSNAMNLGIRAYKGHEKTDWAFRFKKEALTNQPPAFYHLTSRGRLKWLQKNTKNNRMSIQKGA